MDLIANRVRAAAAVASVLTSACGSRVGAFSLDASITDFRDGTGVEASTATDGERDGRTDAQDATSVSPDAAADAAEAGVGAVPCPDRQWCWQNPLPQGNALGAVFTVSATEAWAFGARGATVRYADGRWTSSAPVTDVTLRQTWGSGPSDVWAWGVRDENSPTDERHALVRWDGARWSVVPHGPLPVIQDLSGSAANNVWMVTAGTGTAQLWQWDGARFVAGPALPASARPASVCTRGPREGWVTAIGASSSDPAALYRWDGSAWSLAHRADIIAGERFDSRVTCPADGVAVVAVFDFLRGEYTYLEARVGRVTGNARPLGEAARLVRTPHGEAYYANARTASRWTPTGWQPALTLSLQTLYGWSFDRLTDGSAGWLAEGSPVPRALRGGEFPENPSEVRREMRVFVADPSASSDPVAVFGDLAWGRRDGDRWIVSTSPMISAGMLFSANDAWGADPGQLWVCLLYPSPSPRD